MKEIQKKLHKSEEHPDVCVTLYQIAVQRYDLNKYQEALSGFENVLKLQKKIFQNDDHPEIKITQKWIDDTKNKMK